MGRPTECTLEMIETLALAVREGLSIEKACDLNDICQKTFCNWRNRGDAGEEPYLQFVQCIKRAFAKRTEDRLKRIADFSKDRPDGKGGWIKGEWQPLAWLEERQNRQEFSRFSTKIKLIEAPESLSETAKIAYMSDDVMRRLRAGDISAEEANITLEVLDKRNKLVEATIKEERMQEIEKRLGIKSTA